MGEMAEVPMCHAFPVTSAAGLAEVPHGEVYKMVRSYQYRRTLAQFIISHPQWYKRTPVYLFGKRSPIVGRVPVRFTTKRTAMKRR
jgi:hypothetical protein